MAKFASDLLETQDKFKKSMDGILLAEAKKEQETPQFRLQFHNNFIANITTTHDLLATALKKHGIAEYSVLGQKFDPSLHEAVFEYMDPSKPAGTIGVVVQAGYMIGKRILRAPKVGVIKK